MSSFDGPTEELERHELPKKDFFISYSGKDKNVVAWINQTLEEAGFTTVLQMRDFATGTDFVANINDALKNSERVIAVISSNYLNSNYTAAEFNAALALSWREGKNILVPILIENVDFIAHYNIAAPIAYLDISAILDDPVAASSLINERMHQLVTNERLPSVFELPLRISPAPTIPPKYYEKLFGREQDLEAVVTAIKGRDKIVAICGQAGVGKTALATEIVTELYETSEFDICIWVDAEQTIFLSEKAIEANNPINSYDSILNKIGLELGLILPQDIIQKEVIVSRALTTSKALITIDGIDNIENYEAVLDRLFKVSGNSKLIITCTTGTSHPMSKNVRLNGLNSYNTLEYVRDYAETKNVNPLLEANLSEINRIVAATGGLPLAINLIIGQVYAGVPLPLVLEGLENLQSRNALELYRYLFEGSWNSLKESTKLLLLSISCGTDLSVELLAEITRTNPIEMYEEVYELSRLNLVYLNSLTKRVTPQPILMRFLEIRARDNTNWQSHLEEFRRNLSLFYLNSSLPSIIGNTHLGNIINSITYFYDTNNDAAFIKLLANFSLFVNISTLDRKFEPYFERVTELLDKPQFEEFFFPLMQSKATSFYTSGMYSEAEEIFKNIIIKADALGNHHEKLVSLEALASIRIETERLEEAIMFYEEVIAAASQLEGTQVHISFARKHMSETAYNFYLQLISDHEEEKIDDQELLSTIDRAIVLFKKTNRSTVEIAEHLADIGYDLLDYYREYMETDPEYIDELYDKADVADLENSKALILKAIDIFKTEPLTTLWDLARNIGNLGDIEFLLNNYTAAKTYLDEYLELFQKIPTEKDDETGITYIKGTAFLMEEEDKVATYTRVYETLWKIAVSERDLPSAMSYAKKLVELGSKDYEIIEWIEKYSEQ